MERLEAAFKEALARNAHETERWNKYQEEQKTAISNMKEFRDSLTVDIMVPVGTKAFMPGQLCHTNEILVSHYQGYFSKCTSLQAQKIAAHRIKMARSRLDDLEIEREMYQNKLDRPYLEGMLPTGAELEIVEEYDDEKEKQWRIDHKRRVREEKLQPPKAELKSQEDKTHDDIMAMLENLEIMEELEDDLNQLEIEDDEKLEQLMSGAINAPEEKKRASLPSEKDIIIGKPSEKNAVIIDEIAEKLKSSIVTDVKQDVNYTNNNVLPNTQDYVSDDDDSGSTSTEDIPPQVLEIEDQAKDLSTTQKVKFFKKKLKEVEKELQEMVLKSADDIDKKISKMEVREFLFDYIEVLKDELETGAQLEQNTVGNTARELITDTKKKKRITFSNKDEVQLIDKTQAPNMVTRSKIELSADSYRALNLTPPTTLDVSLSPDVDKKKDVLDKVQKCIEFISENQSQQDFNLVDKIIDSTESKCHTLEIKFNHSENYITSSGYEIDKSAENGTIGSPADLYRVFNDYFPSEQYETQSTSNVPDSAHPTNNEGKIDVTQEETKINAHSQTAPITSPSNTGKRIGSAINLIPASFKYQSESDMETKRQPDEPVKPILKNRESVKAKGITPTPMTTPHKKPKPNKDEKVKKQGFDLIMGEVVERNIPSASENKESEENSSAHNYKPDPLPEENFVDVYAPKPRVSRFKQMRANR